MDSLWLYYTKIFAHWQLPTYDGTKSYQNLLVGVYGETWNSDWQKWNGSYIDSIHQRSAINLIRGGYYATSGGLFNKNSTGYYSQANATSTGNAAYLYFDSTTSYPQTSYYKGNGYSLRCLVPLVPSQLPTYDGTKSYQNLLVGVYGGTDGGNNRDAIIQQIPINFIRSGYYAHSSGKIENSNGEGDYWTSRATYATHAYLLYFRSSVLASQTFSNKGQGFSLRCLGR